MQNSKASVPQVQHNRRNRVPDYTGDQHHAKELAKRIQTYYHDKGYKAVRCWVEPELFGKGRKIWGVRSNIIFDLTKVS